MSTPSNLTAWERWELASFDENHKAPALVEPSIQPSEEEVAAELVKLPTAEEIEQILQQARDDGFQKGLEEGRQSGLEKGLEEGQAKIRAEATKLAQATNKLNKSLEELDAKVAEELLALAIEIAREVVRQEISARPETLLDVVREALSQLPHQHAAIYLHPEDASLLRSYMGDQLSHAGHRIHEDFKLGRGDCVLEAGGSQLDATIAMRWRRVLEGLGLASAWEAKPAESSRGDTHES